MKESSRYFPVGFLVVEAGAPVIYLHPFLTSNTCNDHIIKSPRHSSNDLCSRMANRLRESLNFFVV